MFVTGQVVKNLGSLVTQVVGHMGNDPVLFDGLCKWRANPTKCEPATLDEALASGFTTQHRELSSELFGGQGNTKRFKLSQVLTRFGVIMWQVSDAHIINEVVGLPEIVVQEYDKNTAILKAMMMTDTYETTDPWQDW